MSPSSPGHAPQNPGARSVRADRFLWAVRAFKTRAMAAAACRAQQVEVGGRALKPAAAVRPGDVIAIAKDGMTRTLRVNALVGNRVGAKKVPAFVDDLTPEAELEKARQRHEQDRANRVFSAPGQGRPTKRQRRLIHRFMETLEAAESAATQDNPDKRKD